MCNRCRYKPLFSTIVFLYLGLTLHKFHFTPVKGSFTLVIYWYFSRWQSVRCYLFGLIDDGLTLVIYVHFSGWLSYPCYQRKYVHFYGWVFLPFLHFIFGAHRFCKFLVLFEEDAGIGLPCYLCNRWLCSSITNSWIMYIFGQCCVSELIGVFSSLQVEASV